MNKLLKIAISGIIIIVVIVAFIVVWTDYTTKEITSFEKCKEAGYQIKSISPFQEMCKIPFGKGFGISILIPGNKQQ